MTDYHYLIIGGGMTADAAAHGIRERDADQSIGIIGAESDPPYNRPPLSKGLWRGDALESITASTVSVPWKVAICGRSSPAALAIL